MTYKEKLIELYENGVQNQTEFVKVAEEIVKRVKEEKPLGELVQKKDRLYRKFQQDLKEHMKLIRYISIKKIPLDREYQDINNVF